MQGTRFTSDEVQLIVSLMGHGLTFSEVLLLSPPDRETVLRAFQRLNN